MRSMVRAVFWKPNSYESVVHLRRITGPIVRINPEELHIDDPSFYDQIYVGPSRRTNKWHWSAKMFGTTNATVGTTDHDLHRMRRSALNPFFSKQAVMKLEPIIRANINRLRDRLADLAGTGNPVNMSDAFTCLSADVIGAYAFGQEYGLLDCEDFCPRWRLLMMVRASHQKTDAHCMVQNSDVIFRI